MEKNKGYYVGKSWDYRTVKFKSDKNDLIGEFVKIKIKKALSFGLEGELAKLIVLLGPTASGKTDISIRLSNEFNGEIVSADSRLVYKKMDIGTAKPKDLKGVKHYLIDIINPEDEYNVALFKKDAEKAICNILNKNKTPFLVGGTGLYISSIMENINFPEIKPDLKLRKELEEKSKETFEIYKS